MTDIHENVYEIIVLGPNGEGVCRVNVPIGGRVRLEKFTDDPPEEETPDGNSGQIPLDLSDGRTEEK